MEKKKSDVEIVNDSRATQPQNPLGMIPNPAKDWATLHLNDYIDQKAKLKSSII